MILKVLNLVSEYLTDYIVYIDEAGDAAIDHNNRQVDGKHSEWLCLGGYLVTREQDNVLHDVRNELATLIGGTHGQALHFRRYTNENKEKICDLLGQKTARGFVVCPKKTRCEIIITSEPDKRGPLRAIGITYKTL